MFQNSVLLLSLKIYMNQLKNKKLPVIMIFLPVWCDDKKSIQLAVYVEKVSMTIYYIYIPEE